jgi:hypothetical protein
MDPAVAVTVLIALYAAACWLWPFARCRRCDGSGKRPSPSGRAWRRCDRCRGSGEWLRLGARVLGSGRRRRR